MKRSFMSILLLAALLLGLTSPALAAEEDRYAFTLLADGENAAEVQLGDTVTVSLVLRRADGADFDLYSVQDYVCFDPGYLEFVDGSILTYPAADGGTEQLLEASPVKFSAAGTDVYNRVYVNRASGSALSMASGSVLLTFRLKAVKAGRTTLSHAITELFRLPGNLYAAAQEDAAVTITDGSGTPPVNPPVDPPVGPVDPPVDPSTEPPTDPGSEEAPFPFVDVTENDWFYDEVYQAWAAGLILGVDGTHYRPRESTTRAAMATVMYRLAGGPEYSYDGARYPDVRENSRYTDPIYWATENEIMIGYSNGNFGPNDCITREQFAAVLWRYGGRPESGTSLDGFTDADAASNYAVPALCWAVETGILQGRSSGALTPGETASRAEVAVMLVRFLALAQGGETT